MLRSTSLIAVLSTALILPAACGAQDLIGSLEGVYKVRGISSIVVPGEASEIVQVEDVLEIVRVDDSHAYFRTRLMFDNGHRCSLWGVAEQRGDELLYRQSADLLPGLPACALKIRRSGDTVMLTDRWEDKQATSCSSACGARGSLHDARFPFKSKRAIGYLPRLKSAREYREALAEQVLSRQGTGTPPTAR